MTRPRFTAAQRLKCFEDHGAIVCCQGPDCDSAIYIKGCDIDHHLALIDGGKHEQENFRPLCGKCHAKKSAYEHRANAKAKRIVRKNSGQEQKPTRRLQGRKFAAGTRSWPETSPPLPSRKFQKRYRPNEAAE